ncbi:galactose-1-phosphate uridylyltransferase [Candidatus Berkelbacteria bacterium]|nr:galactose-1-phosphate uridylyltransferase [Candidatus Berkelbacteria bacterium]MBI4029589.1 galactose-1-phosphate uridylyltransferase [Candidatus Berkelbacteria bacterium]
MPKLRQNIVTGDWVIIAPERAQRPFEFISREKVLRPSKKDCLFERRNLSRAKIPFLPVKARDVYVIPNKYPAFVTTNKINLEGGQLYNSTESEGYHEVVIFKDHNKYPAKLTTAHLAEIIDVYRQRYLIHIKDPVVKYVLIIHNHGTAAGASIYHPHSQIFASPIIPNSVRRILQGAKAYYHQHRKCAYCEIIRHEQKEKIRLLKKNRYFTAFCPFASRFPFEMRIVPQKHQSNFEKITPAEVKGFAHILREILAKLDKGLKNPPYNFYIHTNAARQPENSFFHWHLEVVPRLGVWGGFELGGGFPIDVISPEKCANFLRKVRSG